MPQRAATGRTARRSASAASRLRRTDRGRASSAGHRAPRPARAHPVACHLTTPGGGHPDAGSSGQNAPSPSVTGHHHAAETGSLGLAALGGAGRRHGSCRRHDAPGRLSAPSGRRSAALRPPAWRYRPRGTSQSCSREGSRRSGSRSASICSAPAPPRSRRLAHELQLQRGAGSLVGAVVRDTQLAEDDRAAGHGLADVVPEVEG